MARIGILIVDDDKQFIKNLTKILSSYIDIEILGMVSSGYEGVLEAALLQPDVVLMGHSMESPLSGIHASKALLKHFPNMKIVILIDDEQSDIIQAANKAGIVDYILKKSSPKEIVKTIKEVARLIDPRHDTIADKFYRRTLHREGVHDSLMYTLTKVSLLTPGELEITKMLAEGMDYHQISKLRNVDLQSIHKTVDSILKKFNKESVDELIKVIKTLNLMELLDNIL